MIDLCPISEERKKEDSVPEFFPESPTPMCTMVGYITFYQ